MCGLEISLLVHPPESLLSWVLDESQNFVLSSFYPGGTHNKKPPQAYVKWPHFYTKILPNRRRGECVWPPGEKQNLCHKNIHVKYLSPKGFVPSF